MARSRVALGGLDLVRRPPRVAARRGSRRRPRVARTTSRRALRDDLAELEHEDVVADAEHEPHVVVDEQHRRPASTICAQLPAERLALGGVEPGRRLVEAARAAAARPARAPRRPACAGPAAARSGSASATRPARPSADVEHRSSPVVGRPRERCRAAVAPATPGWAATVRFSRRSGRRTARWTATCATSPRWARACGAQPRDVRAVELDRAACGHEAGDRVDERRLAGAVGADQPDELALARPRGRRRRRRARRRSGRTGRVVASTALIAGRPRSARRPPAATRCLAPPRVAASPPRPLASSRAYASRRRPPGSGSAVRISATPPKSSVQLPEMPNDVCRASAGTRPSAAIEPAEDRAGDHRDAADVGERDEAERDEDAEPVGAHRAEVVGVQRARRRRR